MYNDSVADEVTDMSMMDPVCFTIFVSHAFSTDGAGIDVKLLALLELPLVTGKMFTHMGDTCVAHTIMC